MAVAVAGARVLQNSHWLGDVLAGTALGWVTPWLVLAVWRARWPGSAPRQSPVTTS